MGGWGVVVVEWVELEGSKRQGLISTSRGLCSGSSLQYVVHIMTEKIWVWREVCLDGCISGMLSSSQINVLQQCSLKYTLLSCASTLEIRARGIVLTFPHPSVLHAPCFDSPGHRLDIHKTPHRIRSQNQVALSACTFPVDSPRRSYALVSTRFPQGYRRTGTVFGSLCP